ncbi:hypothetical protein [Bradyrhizobium sp. LA6.12]|uniref:hypothetical protein n=1 Tax=unclassified Bradyrhizobium TaxID=2631580 RepID=UPI0033952B33
MTQGGPGNEPQPEERKINISQSLNAQIATGGSLMMALQAVLKYAVWPDRMKIDAPTPNSRLEFLAKEALREIKNATANGFPAADEAAGKQTALMIVEQIAGAIRKEIESRHE